MTLGVELHQIQRHLAHSLAGTLLGLHPGRAAHLAELRRSITVGAVTAEAAQLIRGNPQDAVGVLNHQVVAHLATDGELFKLLEATDAVVAVHHEITGLHLVGVHGAAGGLAPATHISRAGEGLLPEELAVRDQHHAPGGQLQTFQVSRATDLQGHGRGLLHQPLNRRRIGGIGHKTADAVVLLQQRHGTTGLGRQQPHRLLVLAIPLDQFAELAELVGVGRHGAAVEIEGVGMGVTLLEFSQIETGERLRQSHGLIDIAMQQRNRQCQFLMMFARMIQPLLAMGTAMAALINGDAALGRQVIEQGGGLLPGQSHQTTHAFRGSPFQKLRDRLLIEQLLQAIRHGVTQVLGNQRTEARGGQTQAVDRIE